MSIIITTRVLINCIMSISITTSVFTNCIMSISITTSVFTNKVEYSRKRQEQRCQLQRMCVLAKLKMCQQGQR